MTRHTPGDFDAWWISTGREHWNEHRSVTEVAKLAWNAKPDVNADLLARVQGTGGL